MGWSNLLNKISASSKNKAFDLDDRFETGEILGRGTFGVVRRAKIKETGEDVAIKIISRKELKRMKVKETSVLEELNFLQQMDHPHIVKMKSWYKTPDNYYIVTQLCTGGELFDRIIKVGRFTETDAARIIAEVGGAIKYMHDRNIVHRDIKPENLLYSDKRDNANLVLTDFGIAKTLACDDDTIQGGAGSLGYAAPDVFDRAGHGKPCDVWSLGVVMYTILCGYLPFASDSMEHFLAEAHPHFKLKFEKSHWGNISPGAKALISKMLVYNPEDRATIEDVLNDPWFTAQESELDIYSSIKPGLSSLVRWRLGFEKVRLAQKLRANSGDHTNGSAAEKFKEIVLAAQRKQEIIQSQTEEDEYSGRIHHGTDS